MEPFVFPPLPLDHPLIFSEQNHGRAYDGFWFYSKFPLRLHATGKVCLHTLPFKFWFDAEYLYYVSGLRATTLAAVLCGEGMQHAALRLATVTFQEDKHPLCDDSHDGMLVYTP